MGKSYKKHPGVSGTNVRGMKRVANKRVRQRLKDLSLSITGTEFKKLFPSWDIHDFYYGAACSIKRFIEFERELDILYPSYRIDKFGHIPTDDELIDEYRRRYVRK